MVLVGVVNLIYTLSKEPAFLQKVAQSVGYDWKEIALFDSPRLLIWQAAWDIFQPVSMVWAWIC